MLPTELGCGSGSTCWRRLRDGQEAGVWEKLHTRLLIWLGDPADIDWSRASVDSLNVRAKRGGKSGSRYHVVVDRNGLPLAVRMSAAIAHETTHLLPLIDAIPAIVGPRNGR